MHTHRFTTNEPETAAAVLRAGTDLLCGLAPEAAHQDSVFERHLPRAAAAHVRGLNVSHLDAAVRRLYYGLFMVGHFDPIDRQPYARIPLRTVDSPKHRALALTAARKAMVLLRNEGRTLPFPRGRRMAVLGPHALSDVQLLGNYFGVRCPGAPPRRPGVWPPDADWGCMVSPLQAIRLHNPHANVTHIPGASPQEAAQVGRVFVVVRGFTRGHYTQTPLYHITPQHTTPLHHTTLYHATPHHTPPHSVALSGRATGRPKAYLDSRRPAPKRVTALCHRCTTHYTQRAFRQKALPFCITPVASRPLPFGNSAFGTPHHTAPHCTARHNAQHVPLIASQLASEVQQAVLLLGLDQNLESEGHDRRVLTLPRAQIDLALAVLRVGTPTAIVLLNGGAVSIPELSDAPAILEAWYGGQAAGLAIAETLFGLNVPGGKLPVTVYPPNYVRQVRFHDMRIAPGSGPGRTYRFYRGPALFPFGHGLSYTTFRLRLRHPTAGPVAVSNPEEPLTVTVAVANTGPVTGDEVVMVFWEKVAVLHPAAGGVQWPVQQLMAFARVTVAPGAEQEVQLQVLLAELAVTNRSGTKQVLPGLYRMLLGRGNVIAERIILNITGGPLVVMRHVLQP